MPHPLRSLLTRAALIAGLAVAVLARAEEPKLIIFDNDFNGPSTTNLNAALLMIQNPKVKVLGLTVVSGDQWRDESVAHTLRLLEIVGRTDIPVVPGAVFPLLNNEARTKAWEGLYGKKSYKGAWNLRVGIPNFKYHAPYEVPPLVEGNPTTKPHPQHAALFMIEQVRKYPNQITICLAGPFTNLALAARLDPEFVYLVKDVVFMGTNFHPSIKWPSLLPEEQKTTDRLKAHRAVDKFPLNGSGDIDFNIEWDPEAAYIVFHSPFRRITAVGDVTKVAPITEDLVKRIASVKTTITDYVAKYTQRNIPLWDEMTAAIAIDPTLIKGQEAFAMSVNTDFGPNYGAVQIWDDRYAPNVGEQKVFVVTDIDVKRFYDEFVAALQAPTPAAPKE